VFDFARNYSNWYSLLREDSYEFDEWYYSVVFFMLLLVFEIIPLILFILNLRYILSTKRALEPKQMY